MNKIVVAISAVLIFPLIISCESENQTSSKIENLVPTGAAGEYIAPPLVDSTDPLGLEPGFNSSTTIDTLPEELFNRASSDLTQRKNSGHIKLSDEAVDRFTVSEYSKFLNSEQTQRTKEAVVALYPIQGTPFLDMKFHGAAATSFNEDGLVTGITRVFSLDGDTMVTLEEWDYLASNGSVVMHPEFINELVHGMPAILTILTNSKGKAISELAWEKDGKLNRLTISGYITGNGEENELVQLAEALH